MTRLHIFSCMLLMLGTCCYGQTTESPDFGDEPKMEIHFELWLDSLLTTVAPTTVPAPTTTGADITTPPPTTKQTIAPFTGSSVSAAQDTSTGSPTTSTVTPNTATTQTETTVTGDTTPTATETTTTATETTPTTAETTATTTAPPPPASAKAAKAFDAANALSTEEPGTLFPEDVRIEIEDFLISVFENQTGYDNLIITDWSETPSDPVHYTVSYDIETLSDAGMLDDAFIEELRNAKDAIFDSEIIFGEDWEVDGDKTRTEMEAAITEFEESSEFDNLCTTTGYQVCSNPDNTCYHNTETGTISCPNKCEAFDMENIECASPESGLDTIFPPGECKIDDQSVAYCDCGMSPGDVMHNFYDGEKCISSAFVVGMAAGLGGFLIILLLSIAIGLCCCKDDDDKHDKKSKHYTAYDNDQSKHYGKNNEHDVILDDLDKKGHYVVNPGGIDNKGYHGYQEPLDRPTGSDFQANLSHIDPHADYSIQRPSVRHDEVADFGSGGTPVGYHYETIHL